MEFGFFVIWDDALLECITKRSNNGYTIYSFPMKVPISDKTIDEAIAILKRGGVVAHPTDTCYGFAADIMNPLAVSRIVDLKAMADHKPMSIVVSSVEEMSKYGVMSPRALEIAEQYLPGALTLVLPKTEQIPSTYYPDQNFIGIRIPDHELTIQLVQKLGRPITTTSANITKYPEPYSASEVVAMFEGQLLKPDLVFETDSVLEKQQPSTVVRVVGDEVTVLREGVVRVTRV